MLNLTWYHVAHEDAVGVGGTVLAVNARQAIRKHLTRLRVCSPKTVDAMAVYYTAIEAHLAYRADQFGNLV